MVDIQAFALFLLSILAISVDLGLGTIQGCYTQNGCSGTRLQLSSTDTGSQIRECCLSSTGLSYRNQLQCVDCIVYGFLDQHVSGHERGQPYDIFVGYLKGIGPTIKANVVPVPGGSASIVSDFFLNIERVNIHPGKNDAVSFVFRLDGIAQENIERVTLRLVRTSSNFPPTGIFQDEIKLEIIDSDVALFKLTEDDYSSDEADLRVNVVVSKNVRLANEVRFILTPFNVSEAERSGQPLPASIPPDDNPLSPNRAKSFPPNRQDFSSEVLTVVFPADETGQQRNEKPSHVAIFDDEINEALEEVFIVVLSLDSAVNPKGISIRRPSSLCKIIDNDDIRIGFQNHSYIFAEPEYETEIYGVVFLEKENGRISEQTFCMVIEVGSHTPSNNIQPASLSTRYGNNDYVVTRPDSNFITPKFTPEAQTLEFIFTLFPDSVPEGTEAFKASSNYCCRRRLVEPVFTAPLTLFASTFIIITDVDSIVIGFERTFTVPENIGKFQACFRVIDPTANQPLTFSIDVVVDTVVGTAESLDFVAISSANIDVLRTLDQNVRRACFDVQILNDQVSEGSETFSLQLSLGQTVASPVRDNIVIQPSIVYVTIEDTAGPETIQGCYDQRGCSGTNLQLRSTDRDLQIRECCLSSGLSYNSRVQCVDCIVYGFLDQRLSKQERCQPYDLIVGYLKGTGPTIKVKVVPVPGGSATEGSDFFLTDDRIIIHPARYARVSVTFQVDSIAQENNEMVTLRLERITDNFPATGIFQDEIELEIIDGDVAHFKLTKDHYSSDEADLRVNVVVSKNVRLANDVRFILTPFTVSEAEESSQPLPASIPPNDNPLSPNRAKSFPPNRQDFSSEVLTVVFPADETGQQRNEKPSPVAIFDDEINEALEEVFIVVLSLHSAVNPNGISIRRPSSLCKIIDNDDIRIGFQNHSYIFAEPEYETEIYGVVFLEKENGRISEQTFHVVIDAGLSTPSNNIQPASLSNSYSSNDYLLTSLGVSFISLEFTPAAQTLEFIFTLFSDSVPEGTEAFKASFNYFDCLVCPVFTPPLTLFASTFIIITDDDPIVIGFEQNFIVPENVGSFQACFRVLSPTDDQPFTFSIYVVVNSIVGTAGSSDFVEISSSCLDVFHTLDQNVRRVCFDVHIISDQVSEGFETFSLQLSLDQFVDPGIRDRVLFHPSVMNVTIEDTTGPATIQGCYLQTTCSGTKLQLNSTDTDSQIRECCLSSHGLSYSNSLQCVVCVVYGFIDTRVSKPECGQPYDIFVGYLKGSGPTIQASVVPVSGGNATVGSDFYLSTGRVIIHPGLNDRVSVTFRMDSIAQENIEMTTLRLVCTTRTFQSTGIFQDEIKLEIIDSDVVNCEQLLPPTNGSIILSGSVFQSNAMYSCNAGFNINGNAVRTCCKGNGEWSDEAPTCQVIDCGQLPPLTDGSVFHNGTMLGSTAKYSCNAGFNINGTAMRVCEGNGEWSGKAPTCQGTSPAAIPGCFDQSGCAGSQFQLNSTDSISQIRECCLSSSGLSYSLSKECFDCMVTFSLKGTLYFNGSSVSLSEVGIDGEALIFHTEFVNCCKKPKKGECYYPDGSLVQRKNSKDGKQFYRDRGNQFVRLNNRGGSTVGQASPTGLYCCTVPNPQEVLQKICVNITA